MNTQTPDFISEYAKWIKQNSKRKQFREYEEISTPFLDIHNDVIQFYVTKQGNEFLFTDDGYTINDLEMNGINLSTQKRQEMIHSLAEALDVTIEDKAITARTSDPSMIAPTEHKLIQAMLKFSDMLMLESPHIKTLFLDVVGDFFTEKDIRFTPSIMFAGRSGLSQRFDFVIPASRISPERIITALNRPNRQTIQSSLFAWDDVKTVRHEGAVNYMILNDEKSKNKDLISAADSYGVTAFWWGDREQYVSELAS